MLLETPIRWPVRRRSARAIARTVAVASFIMATSGAAAAQSMLVSVDELSRSIGDSSIVVLHIAENVARFEEGHIPGARFVRYGEFAVAGEGNLGSELPSADTIKRVFEAAGVSDTSRVILYGHNPVLPARAFFTLDVFGHRNVALLDGGLRAWREAGRPVEQGRPGAVTTGRFTPRLNRQRLADAALIQQHKPGRSMALVDVRPDDEFFGRSTMGGAHAPGHIAGAKQLTWNSLVGADGRFLTREQLKQKLEFADAAPGRPLVAYCMVGMRASVVYFVSRMLGYDARLYDGSIMDWSARRLPTVQD